VKASWIWQARWLRERTCLRRTHQRNTPVPTMTFGMSLLADVVTRARDTVAPVFSNGPLRLTPRVNELTFISVTFDNPSPESRQATCG